MSLIRVKAHEIIDSISEKKIAQVLDFLEYLKIKEEYEATKDIVSDKVLYAAIEKGLLEVQEGEVIDFESVKEDV